MTGALPATPIECGIARHSTPVSSRSWLRYEVPAGPVFNLAEVFADPQAQHLGLRQPLQHPTAGEVSVTGFPWRFSATPAEIRLPPPLLGQHNQEALEELGYSSAEIANLRQQGAIG
jgi:crotonobetainyl-CoA:carnitine CoA-transferase CaiB-like acyl-CoA transferase